MKTSFFFFFIFLSLVSCTNVPESDSSSEKKPLNQSIDSTEMTNNFYDNVETIALPVHDLYIEGEVANPGKVDFSVLPVHSVIVKETLLDSAGGDRFTGAYRYDGYSLFDILNNSILKKANSADFRPIIDLYVEVEDGSGNKVVFSWGEIYYPVNLHKILIASSVARIVPSKTKDLWPLPVESRIVAAGDLITERNISSPVKITVRSYPLSVKVQQGMSPMYSAGIEISGNSGNPVHIENLPGGINKSTFNTIFYGRGKGIHSTKPFTGFMLKEVLQEYYPFTKENLRSGIVCIAGLDGYRSVLSYSELFNRNDQQEFMLVETMSQEDGGHYRVFAAADFFSDRAIKSVRAIYLSN